MLGTRGCVQNANRTNRFRERSDSIFTCRILTIYLFIFFLLRTMPNYFDFVFTIFIFLRYPSSTKKKKNYNGIIRPREHAKTSLNFRSFP